MKDFIFFFKCYKEVGKKKQLLEKRELLLLQFLFTVSGLRRLKLLELQSKYVNQIHKINLDLTYLKDLDQWNP